MSKSSFSIMHMQFGGGKCQHSQPLSRIFVCLWAAQKLCAQHFWSICLDNLLGDSSYSSSSSSSSSFNKDYIQMPPQWASQRNRACHQPPLQKSLHTSTASSAVPERSNATNALCSHHFVAHITSKLIWEGPFPSWKFNSITKFVVAVENHCTRNLFLAFMISTHLPLHHVYCIIFSINMSSSPWVTGLSSSFWLMINKLESLQNSKRKNKSNNWKAVDFKWNGKDENIGLLFDAFNFIL